MIYYTIFANLCQVKIGLCVIGCELWDRYILEDYVFFTRNMVCSNAIAQVACGLAGQCALQEFYEKRISLLKLCESVLKYQHQGIVLLPLLPTRDNSLGHSEIFAMRRSTARPERQELIPDPAVRPLIPEIHVARFL